MEQVGKIAVSIFASSREMADSEIAHIRKFLCGLGLSDVRIRVASHDEHWKIGIPLELVLKVCCIAFCVPEGKVRSKSREREVVYARHAYHAIAKDMLDYSLSRIGSLTNKNHATVHNSIKVSSNLIETKYAYYTRGYDKAMELLKKQMYGDELSNQAVENVLKTN